MLTMTEPSEQDGKIRGVMNIRITGILPYRTMVWSNNRPSPWLGSQVEDESTQLPKVFAICRFQLTQLFPVLTVMA